MKGTGIQIQRRPKDYAPPKWAKVESLLAQAKKDRAPVIDAIRQRKQARRDQWDDVIKLLPQAYRNALPPLGFPDLEEMLLRVVGMIAKQQPMVQVIAPSGSPQDVRKASKEEARLHATRIAVQDQQDRDVYAMGIDAQCGWGESWISVWPDPSRFDMDEEEGESSGDDEDEGKEAVKEAERIVGYRRGKSESAKDYGTRYARQMADGGVPICIEDHDGSTVFPLYVSKGGALRACFTETMHTVTDINLGLGYRPLKGEEGGKGADWVKGTLSEGYVPQDTFSSEGRSSDTTHDLGATSGIGARPTGRMVRRVCYMDPWVYQCYLDGVKVEEWNHDWGFVPMFPAFGEQSSDRDPGMKSRGIIDGALVLARQIVYWSAILAANASEHGFPTPFIKNPDHGIVANGSSTAPNTRTIVKGGPANLLGPNEDIVFPYLDAQMMPDFFKHLDFLLTRMESMTLNGWGKDVSADTSGYALAQLRALQQSILATVYLNAARQWRKINYAFRYIVRNVFPAGIYLPGAVETKEVDGVTVEYQAVLEYAKEHCTDFAIQIHIDEGILQDEMAERKSAIEMVQAGLWAKRRAQEKSGVEDPDEENKEIRLDRLMDSPATDQLVLTAAAAKVAQRFAAMMQTANSSPFMQFLQQAQQQLLGQAGGPGGGTPGMPPAPTDGTPVNALAGGQPAQQSPTPATPLQGGPTSGPPASAMGVPSLPGGVEGGTPPVSTGV